MRVTKNCEKQRTYGFINFVETPSLEGCGRLAGVALGFEERLFVVSAGHVDKDAVGHDDHSNVSHHQL